MFILQGLCRYFNRLAELAMIPWDSFITLANRLLDNFNSRSALAKIAQWVNTGPMARWGQPPPDRPMAGLGWHLGSISVD
ncbi:hypothetical protein AMR42_14515 [Limnothrix sp. PR1529]|nr:hypothetical protein BCR12_05675 [Limnothrix sp. P13C2]PIB07329.1 hypothetical protein AMR42_14515 [Limnothrix sp. PR1529]